jgi:hypothetical protein
MNMSATPKERAITKTKLEITKDISQLIEMAKYCGYGELQYFLHYLHFIRLLPGSENVHHSQTQVISVYEKSLTDTYKYIIQILAKHGKNGYLKNTVNNLYINSNLVQLMTKVVTAINAKFETLSMLTLFSNIEVSGERDQHIKLNLEEVTKDKRLSKFFYYGVRADRENDFQKENPKVKNDFLNHFKNEYNPYADLFLKEFDISIDDFVNLIDWILETIANTSKSNEKKYVQLDNGKIDVQAYQTILLFGFSMFIKKQNLIDKFGNRVNKVLDRLIFKPEQFDEQQLKYNLIARQPILDKGDFFIVSPEVLLDSLFVNSHYSLLEAGSVKEDYKKRYSKTFVDKISEIADKHGFKEFARDFDLYEGKNQIGDLDIVLKNDKNEFLLVEAKNHSIPMDVYFHDQEATEKRLQQLTIEWENKVAKRQKHMEIHHSKYGIPNTFRYIIITKTPEILSHFSNFLILSLDEFTHWLKTNNINTTFDDIIKSVYKFDEVSFTEEQLEMMQKDLSTGWRFAKE